MHRSAASLERARPLVLPASPWGRPAAALRLGQRLVWLLALSLLAIWPATQAWDSTRMIQAATRAGAAQLQAARSVEAMLSSARALDEAGKVTALNQFVNRRVLFVDDPGNWGQTDYWASPLETLVRGRGDCEDYAIAKYFLLLAAGVPVSHLRLVYVRATLGGTGTEGSGIVQAHMVLAYYPVAQGDPLILDNLVGEVMPAQRRPDLAPVFSFNGEGLWQGTQGAAAGDPVARLSRWREVLGKAAAEGF
jgi:predicted transglutaminase-like cysteine proteinase